MLCPGVASILLSAAELPVRLQYPIQSNDIILTGIEGESLVFRPTGRDTGGRAYLEMDELERQQAQLHFLFPQAFYDAVQTLKEGNAARALPTLRQHAEPFADYLALSRLPGNMVPTVLVYLDALVASEAWDEAVDWMVRMPFAEAPPEALDRAGDLALALYAAGQNAALERLHTYLANLRGLDAVRLEILMRLAGEWRQRDAHLRAFNLYRRIQSREGSLQVEAQLWVAYSSFYLGHEIVPRVFLEELPEMDVTSPGYSLRELIHARLSIREGDFSAAMRSAAQGRTHANAIDSHYPELLHMVATLYGELGMPGPSASAHRELTLLFPDSPWAAQSREALHN
jgi:hypothetical protein